MFFKESQCCSSVSGNFPNMTRHINIKTGEQLDPVEGNTFRLSITTEPQFKYVYEKCLNTVTSAAEQSGATEQCTTCWTVEFPPLRMAMPNFRVEATMGPISPNEKEHNIGLLKVSAPANTSTYKYCVRLWRSCLWKGLETTASRRTWNASAEVKLWGRWTLLWLMGGFHFFNISVLLRTQQYCWQITAPNCCNDQLV